MSVLGPSVLILGARSDIARPLARLYAEDGYRVILGARRADMLMPDATDLRIRFKQNIDVREFDALDTDGHRRFLDELGDLPETTISLVGLMTPQLEAQVDFKAANLMIASNFVGLVSVLGEIANRMEQRGSGTIIGVSSVAGERGRAANYIYGSAKAGFTAFLSGLRSRLIGTGVTVITIKPGYIQTRMTEGLKLPPFLTAPPEELAHAIRVAHKKGRQVIYHRSIWRLVMFIIRAIPEPIFARLKL